MCLNTQIRRKEAADCLRDVFGGEQQVWIKELEEYTFSVALAPSGTIASVCVFDIIDHDTCWGKIKFLGTRGDIQGEGYARAAAACALRYFRDKTTDPVFGLFADTHEVKPHSKRIQPNRSAVTYYQKMMGMRTSGSYPPKFQDGVLTSQWMEGCIDTALKKIGKSDIRTQIVDALSYDAIRCKISEGGRREFQLHFTYETFGWTSKYPGRDDPLVQFSGLNGSGSIDWGTVLPTLRNYGISRANVMDAIKKVGAKVSLCAGARSKDRNNAPEFQQQDIPEDYRQLDDMETDDLCLIKAAAGGLNFCGRQKIAQELLQEFSTGREKMTWMTNFLQERGVQATHL